MVRAQCVRCSGSNANGVAPIFSFLLLLFLPLSCIFALNLASDWLLKCIFMIFFWQNPHFIAAIQHWYFLLFFLDFFFLFSFSSSLLVLLKEFNQPFSYFKYNFISDELCKDVQSTSKSQNDLKNLLEQRLFVHSVSLSPSWYLAFSQGC